MEERKGGIRFLFAVQGEKGHAPLLKLEKKRKLLSQLEQKESVIKSIEREEAKQNAERAKKPSTKIFLNKFEIWNPRSKKEKLNQSPNLRNHIPERRPRVLPERMMPSEKLEEGKRSPEKFSKRVRLLEKLTIRPPSQLPVPQKRNFLPAKLDSTILETPNKTTHTRTTETAQGPRINLNRRISPRQQRKMKRLNTFLNAKLNKDISLESTKKKGAPQVKNINFFCLNLNNRAVKDNSPQIQLQGYRARPSSFFRGGHSEKPLGRPIRFSPSIDLKSKQILHLSSISAKKNLTPSLENKLKTERRYREESFFSLPKDDKNFDSVVDFSENLKKHFSKRKQNGIMEILKSKLKEKKGVIKTSEAQHPTENSKIEVDPQLNKMANNLTGRTKASIEMALSPSQKKAPIIPQNKVSSKPTFRLFQPKVIEKHKILHQVKEGPLKLKISLTKKGSFLRNVFNPDHHFFTTDSSLNIQKMRQDLHVDSSEPIVFHPKLDVKYFEENFVFSPHSVIFVDPSISFYQILDNLSLLFLNNRFGKENIN